jgi:hypothetical protein
MTQYSALQHPTTGPMAESRSVTLYRDRLLYVRHKTQATIFVILLEVLAARIYERVCLFNHKLQSHYDTTLTDRYIVLSLRGRC